MLLINPRSVERDNQNAQRKFPFSDAASCTNGKATIVPGAIVDAQLYVPGRDPAPVWMSSVDTDGRLHFSDTAGEFAVTSYPATGDSAVPVTYTGDGGPLPGGVIVFGRASDVASLTALGGQRFTQRQTELTPEAVTWVGIRGVFGFKLDDGNVVHGAVKFKGANGCDVATYITGAGTDNPVCHLRISAVGKLAEASETTGFITGVKADSDNTNFIVSNSNISAYVINITAEGVSTILDDDMNADQENTCDTVKKARGTLPSDRATTPPDCDKDVCETPVMRTITFHDGTEVVGTLPVYDGTALKDLEDRLMPKAGHIPANKRFSGYFDKEQDSDATPKRMYYRYTGKGIGRFTAGKDITLYAHYESAHSSAEVYFNGYGTLHLAAPDAVLNAYNNPIRISGCEMPVPEVHDISDDVLKKGGADALSDIILHPPVPSGSVRIGLRGLNKAYSS